ncbi:MAG: 50S ribosomal protein L24 [Planctomycetota bacterium]
MLRLRRGDTVQVISGDEKGQRGKILRVDLEKHRVIVQGVNLVYKHIRRSQQYPQGGRIQKEAPIHMSNVMLYSEDEGRPVRVRVNKNDKGRNQRISAQSGKPI